MYVLAVMTAAHCGLEVICWRQIWPQVYASFVACEQAKSAMRYGSSVKCVAQDEARK
jgi:hypothetical protein